MSRVVPPPSDDYESRRIKAEMEKKLYQVQELESVDEEARPKKRFQSMLQPDDEKGEDATSESQTPSPYETSFRAQAQAPTTGMTTDQAVPAPPQTSNPLVDNFQTPVDPLGEEENSLPQSVNFYQSDSDYNQAPPNPEWIDDSAPPQPATPPKLTDKESVKAKTSKGPSPAPMMGQKKVTEPSPFMPTSKKPNVEAQPKEAKAKTPTPPKAAPPPHPGFQPTSPSKQNKPPPPKEIPAAKVPVREELRQPQKPVEPEKEIEQKASPKQKESKEEGGSKEKRGPPEIIAPTQTPLPADIQPMAIAAAVVAQPYISPEVLSLYHEMVGRIYIISDPKGVSRTEFVLNNPRYANSRFFGSTITIDRYSTAPNSFNILLSGTNEAVAAFQQHKAELQRAFERQGINIGQLRVVYARKEKGEDSGSDQRGKGK